MCLTDSGGPTPHASARSGAPAWARRSRSATGTLHNGTLGVWSEPGRGTHCAHAAAPRRCHRARITDPPEPDESEDADVAMFGTATATAAIDVESLVELNRPGGGPEEPKAEASGEQQ